MVLWRSRWAAVGAAVAVTLGAGGLVGVGAESPPSSLIAIEPVRVLDTRIDVGLNGPFTDGQARTLDVTGSIPIVLPGNTPGVGTPVPDGATAIVANVTAVSPTSPGFVAVRPGNATGTPTTSNLNFTAAGAVVPNSVTVELRTTGGDAGNLNLFFRGTSPTETTHLLIDIVGYHTPAAAGPQGPPGADGAPGRAGPQYGRTISASTTIVNAGDDGRVPSITIGVDGNPIIAHTNATDKDLLVTHCNDIACTGNDETTTAVDSPGDVGADPSITIGIDGLPVIAHYDIANGDLRVTHCNDIACTGNDETSTTADSPGTDNVGRVPSITIGIDGLPVIAHRDQTNGNLRVTHCNDIACTGNDEGSVTADSAGDVGNVPSITIGIDGNPIISHTVIAGFADTGLRITHCNDVACAGDDETSTTVESGGFVGVGLSITIGIDGNPIISHTDNDSFELIVTHCNDIACTGNDETTTKVLGAGFVDANSSITIGTNGNPIIIHDDLTAVFDLRMTECNDIACTGNDETTMTIDSAGSTGLFAKMTIGADGHPVIAHYDFGNEDLRITKVLRSAWTENAWRS